MPPERFTTPLVAVLLGSLLLVASVTAGATTVAQPDLTADHQPVQSDENTTAADVTESSEDRLASLETLSFSYETETVFNNSTTRSNTSVWIDYENERMRTERNSEYGETITVVNESGTVVYDLDDETLYNRSQTFDRNQTSVHSLSELYRQSEVSLDGRDEIDGAETYRLAIEPESESGFTGFDEMTLWLDAETYVPAKFEMASESDRYSYETTIDFSNVSLNETIDDERFTIDTADNVSEQGADSFEYTSYESLSEMRSNTSSPVTEADVPANATFQSGYVTESQNYSSVSVRYQTPENESLSISETDRIAYNYSENDAYDSVDIGNRTGWYAEFEYGNSTTAVLTWEADDSRYMIYGGVNESTATDIAESIADA